MDRPILQSENDDRKYRYLQLENNLKVILVHEKGMEKSCAALSVHAGYFSDPEEIAGLAHFLEHLLFMGTSKYPKENEYFEFLAKNGGNSNAFTCEEFTFYYFDIDSKVFGEGLDRFSQFFISPLFDADCTNREMNAVHSEHVKNIEQDVWRISEIDRHVCRKEHPYHKFGTGNLDTLNVENIREKVIDFYKKNYSSNLMTLTIYGSDELNVLEKFAQKYFSTVPLLVNGDSGLAKVPQFDPFPFLSSKTFASSSDMGTLLLVQPIKELKRIIFSWQLPELISTWNKNPQSYLTHLLGHESEGSIFAYLQTNQLAVSLVSFVEYFENFSFLKLSIDLTEKGETEYQQVASVVFAFVNLLTGQDALPAQEWIYSELEKINSIKFKFLEKKDPSSYAVSICENLHRFPPKNVLNAPFVHDQFDPVLISSLVNCLKVDNVRILLVSSKPFFPDEEFSVDPNYGTMYKYLKMQNQFLEQLKNSSLKSLHLPRPNEFIPTKFEIFNKNQAAIEWKNAKKRPSSLIPDKLWFKQDDFFFFPKANCNFLLQFPFASDPSALTYCQFELALQIFKLVSSSRFYNARLAGLKFSASLGLYGGGVQFAFGGFNEKMENFIFAVFDFFFNEFARELKAGTFESCKDLLARSFSSMESEPPYVHADYWMKHFLVVPSFSYGEKLECLKKVTFSQFQSFLTQQLACFGNVKSLIHGQISSDQACSIHKHLIKRSCSDTLVDSSRIQRLSPGQTINLYKIVPNMNQSVEIYLQIHPYENTRLVVLSKLYVQIFSEQFFQELRTQEQLGYVVRIRVREMKDSIGISYLVQSNVKDCSYLEGRIETFIGNSYAAVRPKITKSDFRQYAQALQTNLLKKMDNLSVETNHYWNRILASQYSMFDRQLAEAEILESITPEEFFGFIEERLLLSGSERRKVSMWIVSSESECAALVSNQKLRKAVDTRRQTSPNPS